MGFQIKRFSVNINEFTIYLPPQTIGHKNCLLQSKPVFFFLKFLLYTAQELDVVLFREVVPTIYNIIEGRTLPNSRDYFWVNIMTIF